MDWPDISQRLIGLAHMATITDDGLPHVSIVAPAVEGETVWIGTRLSSRKARNLTCDPHASLVWQPGAEVYLDAEVELVHDLDTKRQLWDGGVFGYDPAMFFGTFDDADYVLLQLSPTSGTVMEATEHGIVQHRWCR